MAKKAKKAGKRVRLARLPKEVASRYTARAKRYSRLPVSDMKSLAVKKRQELADIESGADLRMIRSNKGLLGD